MHRQTKAIKHAAKAVLVAGLFAGSVYLSTRAAVSELLPGVALGWEALFHIERAGALLGAIGVVLLIAWRALSGEFPIRFGNVEYATKDVPSEAEATSDSHEYRLRLLEVLAELRDPDILEDDRERV